MLNKVGFEIEKQHNQINRFVKTDEIVNTRAKEEGQRFLIQSIAKSLNDLDKETGVMGVKESDILKNELATAVKSLFNRSELNCLFDTPTHGDTLSPVMAMRWVQIPVLLDSGAVKHVTPASIFSLTVNPTEKSKSGHMCYGADNSEIPNLGGRAVKAQTEDGTPITLDFDVAKISRPLASAAEIMEKNNKIVLDNDSSYIESKDTGAWLHLRRDGNCVFLYLWVQVPEKLVNTPFVRQAA